MKILRILLVIILVLHTPGISEVAINRERPLDLGWRFRLGDFFYSAEYNEYDDSAWRLVDLPHDWGIEDRAGQDSVDVIGPFSRESAGKIATGHTVGGMAWYRKTFVLDPEDSDKTVYVNFDGVYMESEVWVNGQRVGHHANGYMPFYYDVTSFLLPTGESNLISVRVQNIGDNSRWYSGSGIYRHVWLSVVFPLHVDVWGTFVTTPEVTNERATVNINITLKNQSNQTMPVELFTRILDPDGKQIGRSKNDLDIDAATEPSVDQRIQIKNPQLWDTDSASLYRAETSVFMDGEIIDRYISTFGIRTIEFTPEKGFLLNGKSVLLKGACLHHDNGLVGSAAYDRAEERRIEILKANGYNAIRTAHNPPSKQFLDACDRLGMLVLNEAFDTWEAAKRPQGLHRFFRHRWKDELTAFVKRDRNHPCVIIWSIGNEIRERATPRGLEIGLMLATHVRQMDQTRPVTNAICDFWDGRGKSWENTAPAFKLLDVHGYNYQWRRYEEDHIMFPERILVGTESIAREALQNWRQVQKLPYVIGDFVWTGMDHLGESGLAYSLYIHPDSNLTHTRPWPWFNAWCGDIDLIGDKKPQSFYRDVVWGRSQLELAVHAPIPQGKKELISFWGWPDEVRSWNWDVEEGTPLQVSVYSSCPTVRLELNGSVIGEKSIHTDTSITARFEVPYAPGMLKATGVKDGKEIVTKMLETTGAAVAIKLEPDRSLLRADRTDLAYISVQVLDLKGNVVPNANIPIQLQIRGQGELVAAGNASPNEMGSFQQPKCRTFRGKALVILRPGSNPGQIELIAASKGLKGDTVLIRTE